jgi:citrate lyase subunit beta/citryl-CoA lyase
MIPTLYRSLLFVPGNDERKLERATKAGSDAIIVDLEDAVPPKEKVAARRLAHRWIPRLAQSGAAILARVNAIESGKTRSDLLGVVGSGLHAVILPKVEHPQDMRDLDVLLREAEIANKVRPGDTKVIPLIESARGLLRCEQIAVAIDRVVAIAAGAEDYTRDIGVERTADGAALSFLRGTIVNVCAAHGLQAIDTPYPDHRDAAGLELETRLAKMLGMKGKLAIHPDQVRVLHDVFTPSAEEIDHARRVVDAYERGLARGKGAVALDGRMIDAPIAERARALIAAAAR